MSCPGSVRLAAGIECRASTYAEEGAAAHMLAEICLNDGVDALALIGRELNGHAVDAEMADAVQVYLDAVRAELEPGDLLLVEQHFSLDRLRPPGEMFGTADAVIYKPAVAPAGRVRSQVRRGRRRSRPWATRRRATTGWAPAWRSPIAR